MPVLFCSLAVLDLDPRIGHAKGVLSPFISVLCHSDSSTDSPVHVLILSIQAVHGLPRQLALSLSPGNSLRQLAKLFYIDGSKRMKTLPCPSFCPFNSVRLSVSARGSSKAVQRRAIRILEPRAA